VSFTLCTAVHRFMADWKFIFCNSCYYLLCSWSIQRCDTVGWSCV